MSSPSVFHAPVLLDEKRRVNISDTYQRNNRSKKRRPVDPPEEGIHLQSDGYNATNNTYKRRRASPDDIFGTLSLKPPDPPAHSFCKRKKEHNDDDSIGNSSDGGDRRYAKLPRCQNDNDELHGRAIQSKRIAVETSQITSSSMKPDPPSDRTAAATQQKASEMDNEMSIDDTSSTNSNSDGSISEGSLQRAMYQAVFGRRNNAQHQFHSIPATVSGSGGNGTGCCYDAVDSKIEELIRRSRIEAEIRCIKEGKQITKEQEQDDEDKMEMDG
mmetsp:Transcript_857/g.1357  ORF Transcript_857/g.1357 Transcript_857/m.1357 type:complete len:272 (-) Transcript_857:76-891(-)